MDVVLVMFKVNGDRRDFSVMKDRFVIGRKETCDLRVPLPAISREHCAIVTDEDTVSVRDLGSSNGTFLNGHRIQETALSAGDQIVIGPVTFTIVLDGDPAVVEPTPLRSSSSAASADRATAVPVASPSPAPAGDETNLDDSDSLSALLSEFDDDDSFADFEFDEDEK